MRLSFSSDITRGFKIAKLPWNQIYRPLLSQYNYSPSFFTNGYRKADNFRAGNECVILDIDDGWTMYDASVWLLEKNLKALLATTKSHQKEKNGVVCDRFRIVVPFSRKFWGTPKEFSGMMVNIFSFFEDKPDPVAKDCSRFYYGNPGGEYRYIEGKLAINPESFSYTARETPRTTYEGKQEAIVNFFIQNTQMGNRNNMLFRAYALAKDEGWDADTLVREINSGLSNPLDEGEIRVICRT